MKQYTLGPESQGSRTDRIDEAFCGDGQREILPWEDVSCTRSMQYHINLESIEHGHNAKNKQTLVSIFGLVHILSI